MRSVFATVVLWKAELAIFLAPKCRGGGRREKGDADPHIFQSLGGTRPQLDSATIHGINHYPTNMC